MSVLYSLIFVLALIILPLLGAGAAGWHTLFGVVIPYISFLVFVIGFVYKVFDWGKSAVPFRITTTGGQQESLPWIKQNKLDNPSSTLGVIGRMILEVLLFRSLFRNTRMQLRSGPKLSYGSWKWLWLGAIAFHYTFFIILLHHMRFFTEPTPLIFEWLEKLDAILQIGVPTVYLTEFVIIAALLYLLLRRLFVPQMRYISLVSDYFPLLLILGIVVSGILMRYYIRTDVMDIKELTMGLISLNPTVPEGIGSIFYIHLFLVCALLVYFPWSKLMHLGGIFLSPTRNLASNNRKQRHINPWNYEVKLHTYEEWEDDYREKLKEAGIPVEKE